MKLKKIMLITLSIIIAIATVGCGGTKDTSQNENIVPVRVATVETGEISKDFTYISKLKPEERVDIIPAVAGEVESVFFDVGDRVKENDILFVIDQENVVDNINDLEKQLESLNLTIELQELSVESTKDGQYKQQLLVLKQQKDATWLSYDSAKKTYEDTTSLYEKGAVSQQQYDQTKTAYNQASVAYNSASQNYSLYVNDLSKTSIESSEKQLSQTLVQKDQLELSLKNLNEMLDDTSVKSPISGIVSSRNVEKNQMVSQQMASFTVINTNTMSIDVGVSEQVVSKIKNKDIATVTFSTIDDNIFEGEIYAVSPAADDKTSTYLTKIKLKNEDGLLKSGMFAEVSFKVDSRSNIITVPVNAVLTDASGLYVYIVVDNVATKVMVQTGLEDGKRVEITEGLSVGDVIIIDGHNYVENNTKVNIVE